MPGIGGVIDAELNNPLDSPEDRKRKMLAMAIVGGVVAIVVAIILLAT